MPAVAGALCLVAAPVLRSLHLHLGTPVAVIASLAALAIVGVAATLLLPHRDLETNPGNAATDHDFLNRLDTLRDSEARQRVVNDRLVLANEVAQVGVWEWDIATETIHCDGTMAAIYGRQELTRMTYDEWMETIHRSDRGTVDNSMQALLGENRRASIEFRILWPDGTPRFISSSAGALCDDTGTVTRVLGVNMDITERKVSTARISHLAHHDSLTGLPNRELLQDRLQVCVERAKRYRSSLGLLMIDLDSFKRTNDALGHRAGDQVLKMTAARLKAQFRAVDTVARIGGDEFVALLPDLHSQQDAYQLARKALHALNEPMTLDGREIRIGASIGISLYPQSGDDPELLLHCADTAMYSAKSCGGNNVKTFTDELVEITARRSRMDDALRYALQNDEFQLVYQPQVCLASETVTGVEALIRWHSATLGTVMPLDFIPLAEETGLILQIGEWVLRTACRDAVSIQKMLGRPITMAVNLSPRQFQQENLAEVIETVLAESGLAANLLELEITENMLVSDTAGAVAILNRIRGLGVRLSLDDFGTGFSSMSYIVKFNVDRLKVDRSFVSASTSDPSSRTVTKAIIGLAQDLKIAVVAEGVETEEQRKFLLRLGCNDAQGYLFSKPRTLADLAVALKSIEYGANSSSSIRRAAVAAQWSASAGSANPA